MYVLRGINPPRLRMLVILAQNLDAHTTGSLTCLALNERHVPDGLANPLWMCVSWVIMRSRYQREELKALSERRFNVYQHEELKGDQCQKLKALSEQRF